MRSRRKNDTAAFFGAAAAAVCGAAAVFLCIVIFGFIITKIDVEDSMLSVLTSAALCVGSYTGGYVAARRRKENGLLMGLLCGILMFGMIFAGSYFFAGTAGGFSGSAKFVMTLVCASTGGVIGVNSKRNWFRLK